MRLIYLVSLAVLSLTGLAKAQTEVEWTFDGISGLKDVQALAFDTDKKTLFVTLPDRTLHFQLEPLRLLGVDEYPVQIIGEVSYEFVASSNGVDPDGDLFVVGEEDRKITVHT